MGEVQILEKTALDKAVESALVGKFDGWAKMSDVEAKFQAMTKESTITPETPVAEVNERAGVLANVTKTEVMGIEIGKIAVGTFGGVFINELVDGFFAKQTTMIQGIAKLGMSAVTATWGKRWLGKDSAYAIAFVLGVFGLSQVLPVDKWAATAAGSIKGFLPGTIKVTGMERDVIGQASQVASDYTRRSG